jgi:uncharacterized membrane protein YfcA
MEYSVHHLLILGAVYAFSGFIHGVTGFAFAVISVPVLSMLYSPLAAVGITAVIGPPLMIYNTWLHRKNIQLKRIFPLLIAGIVFIPVGAFFLYAAPEGLIMATLGGVVILLTLFTAFSPQNAISALKTRGVGFGFASISGVIAGAFATAGPIVVAYLYNTDNIRKRAKANTQLFFSIMGTAILITHLAAGTVTRERALIAILFIPVAFSCTRLGVYFYSKLPIRLFRILTDAGLVALGCYLVITNL